MAAELEISVDVIFEQLLAGRISTDGVLTAGLEADISLTKLLDLVECLLEAITDIV